MQVKGELLPEAGRPADDTAQGGQSAGSGETLPAQRGATAAADPLGVASEPSRKRAMAQDAGGGRLVDVTPLSELGQAHSPKQVRQGYLLAALLEWTRMSTPRSPPRRSLP